jgi:hypothetical protein
VDADALLPHNDGSDPDFGDRIEDRVHGIPKDDLDALALEDLGDSGRYEHQGLQGYGGGQACLVSVQEAKQQESLDDPGDTTARSA